MTKSSHAGNRDLAGALKRQAKRTGEQTPSVRGSDWRLATVTAVGAGTVTADGMTVRCLETYSMPLVGDVIVISQSSNGNWIAHGRTSAAAPPAMVAYPPTWTVSTGTTPTLGNGTLAGRYWRDGPLVRGVINLTIGSTTALGSGNYFWQLPTNVGGLVEITTAQVLTASKRWAGQGVISPADTDRIGVYMPSAAANGELIRVSAATANPAGAFVSGDQLRISFQYEPA